MPQILGFAVLLCHLTKMVCFFCTYCIYITSICAFMFNLSIFITTQFLEIFQTKVERIVQCLFISFNSTHQSLIFYHICFIKILKITEVQFWTYRPARKILRTPYFTSFALSFSVFSTKKKFLHVIAEQLSKPET